MCKLHSVANESAARALDIVNAVSLPRDTEGFPLACRRAQLAREAAERIPTLEPDHPMRETYARIAVGASQSVAAFHSALHA